MFSYSNEHGFVLRITLQQKSEWAKYVSESVHHDFYHTWHYHSLTSKEEEAILFVYKEGADFIAIPFLKRVIPGTGYYDLHSAYGYLGPISNIRFGEMAEILILHFKETFLRFLKKENIVSVFTKLHPFFNQEVVFEQFGGLHDNGVTVVIDLKEDIAVQRKKYRQTTLDAVKKCAKLGYVLCKSCSEADINAFASLYIQNMQRVGAKDFYVFDVPYFMSLIRSEEFDCSLYLLSDGEEIICGSIVMCTGRIMQGHLIASNPFYLKKSPAKFLVDQISVLGRTMGMKYYNLGGGLGFKENSLLDWKLGFSDLVFSHKSWRYIAEPDLYNFLVEQTGQQQRSEDFFPLYRQIP